MKSCENHEIWQQLKHVISNFKTFGMSGYLADIQGFLFSLLVLSTTYMTDT